MLSSIDFTTIEVWTKNGLTTFYLLLVIELKTRRVHLAGCTPNPNKTWMMQVSQNLTDYDDGFLRVKKYLLIDRDAIFSQKFRDTLDWSMSRRSWNREEGLIGQRFLTQFSNNRENALELARSARIATQAGNKALLGSLSGLIRVTQDCCKVS